jgi:type I restriction enzyme S subunit
MSELPRGWKEAQIGDLCGLINGRAFKPHDWSTSGLPIIRIQNLNNSDAAFNFCDFEVDERFLVDPGELLFAWSGTPGTSFGAHVWNGPKAVLNQHIFRVRFDEDHLDKSYFRYAINTKLDELIGNAHGGVGLAHVTKGVFEATEVPLPPLPEQRRIVAKIDSLTGKSRRAREHLDHIPRLVEKYKQAVLAAAFRGELTREWRDRSGVPCDYEPVEVIRLAKVVTGSTPPTKNKDAFFGGSIPFVKPTDLDAGYDVRTVRETLTEAGAAASRSVPSGSTLVTCIGATIAKTGFARIACCTNQQINALVPDREKVVPEWLYWMVISPEFRQSILDNSSATTLPIINKGRFQQLVLPSVPISEQVEIVHRLETAFTWIDRLATEATNARHLIDRLDQSVLAKAFRGELVPQDPADEPASVLLERIRAERDAAPKAKRGRKAKAA